MAISVRFPQSETPSWDVVRDGEAPPEQHPLGRVVAAVVLAVLALAIGVAVYSWALTRGDVAVAVPLSAQTPMVSEAL